MDDVVDDVGRGVPAVDCTHCPVITPAVLATCSDTETRDASHLCGVTSGRASSLGNGVRAVLSRFHFVSSFKCACSSLVRKGY